MSTYTENGICTSIFRLEGTVLIYESRLKPRSINGSKHCECQTQKLTFLECTNRLITHKWNKVKVISFLYNINHTLKYTDPA